LDGLTITTFQPIQNRRIFEEILAQLQESLASGRLAQGDKLPSERELAAQFQASRTSVREAIRVLEALGVVEVKPGSEHGVTLVRRPARAFRDLLQFQLALQHIDVPALIEFRVVLESWAAKAAAERHTVDDVRRLEALCDEMASQMPLSDFFRIDAEFHLAIAESSRNDLLGLTLDGARTTIERAMYTSTAALSHDWPKTQRRLTSQHRSILDAIVAHDGLRAENLLKSHILGFYSASIGAAVQP
jgi:GntR family transcriptional regulator, transcriptional repressor for pyruvate dehydrogenase complex